MAKQKRAVIKEANEKGKGKKGKGKEKEPIAKSVGFTAAAKTDTPELPAGAVGLDSWANVWLRYAS